MGRWRSRANNKQYTVYIQNNEAILQNIGPIRNVFLFVCYYTWLYESIVCVFFAQRTNGGGDDDEGPCLFALASRFDSNRRGSRSLAAILFIQGSTSLVYLNTYIQYLAGVLIDIQ